MAIAIRCTLVDDTTGERLYFKRTLGIFASVEAAEKFIWQCRKLYEDKTENHEIKMIEHELIEKLE